MPIMAATGAGLLKEMTMDTRPSVVHRGWMTGSRSEAKQPGFTTTKKGKTSFLDTPPLELVCSPSGLTEAEWRHVEAWIRQVVPVKQHPITLRVKICTCRQQTRPLEFRLTQETAPIRRTQRDRLNVSVRAHDHDKRPVQLEMHLHQVTCSD